MKEAVVFDSRGAAVLRILRNGRIVDFGGRSIGFVKATDVYDYNGTHRGFLDGGLLRDHDGATVGFTDNVTSSAHPLLPLRQLVPLASLDELEPLRPLPELPPLRPFDRFDWSHASPLELFEL